MVTIELLKALAPQSKRTGYRHLAGLSLWMNQWFPEFGIDTKGELCHILTQFAHESDSFNAMEEYGISAGRQYEGNLDLGNNTKGDGIKFKGRGPLQVTGRKNYMLMGIKSGKPMRFIYNPELLATAEWGVWSACIFWTEKGLVDISNMPDSALIWSKKFKKDLSPVEYITSRVNGGFNHLDERKAFYEKAKLLII